MESIQLYANTNSTSTRLILFYARVGAFSTGYLLWMTLLVFWCLVLINKLRIERNTTKRLSRDLSEVRDKNYYLIQVNNPNVLEEMYAEFNNAIMEEWKNKLLVLICITEACAITLGISRLYISHELHKVNYGHQFNMLIIAELYIGNILTLNEIIAVLTLIILINYLSTYLHEAYKNEINDVSTLKTNLRKLFKKLLIMVALSLPGFIISIPLMIIGVLCIFYQYRYYIENTVKLYKAIKWRIGEAERNSCKNKLDKMRDKNKMEYSRIEYKRLSIWSACGSVFLVLIVVLSPLLTILNHVAVICNFTDIMIAYKIKTVHLILIYINILLISIGGLLIIFMQLVFTILYVIRKICTKK